MRIRLVGKHGKSPCQGLSTDSKRVLRYAAAATALSVQVSTSLMRPSVSFLKKETPSTTLSCSRMNRKRSSGLSQRIHYQHQESNCGQAWNGIQFETIKMQPQILRCAQDDTLLFSSAHASMPQERFHRDRPLVLRLY